MTGIGKQVKKTVINRKGFLPKTSLKYPIGGLIKNESVPLIPQMRPLIMRVWPGKVSFKAVIVGVVSRPQAKNSANITIKA